MKILILGNLHSLASLQDALSGKGLPPIPGELEKVMTQHSFSDSPFDCVVLDNEPAPGQQPGTAAVFVSPQGPRMPTPVISIRSRPGQKSGLDDRFIEEVDRRDGENSQDIEPVVFEYHAPCRTTKRHQGNPD